MEFCRASLLLACKPTLTFVSPWLYVLFSLVCFQTPLFTPILSTPFISSLHCCQGDLSKEELSLPSGTLRWLLIVSCRGSNLVLRCHHGEYHVPAVWYSSFGMLSFPPRCYGWQGLGTTESVWCVRGSLFCLGRSPPRWIHSLEDCSPSAVFSLSMVSFGKPLLALSIGTLYAPLLWPFSQSVVTV